MRSNFSRSSKYVRAIFTPAIWIPNCVKYRHIWAPIFREFGGSRQVKDDSRDGPRHSLSMEVRRGFLFHGRRRAGALLVPSPGRTVVLCARDSHTPLVDRALGNGWRTSLALLLRVRSDGRRARSARHHRRRLRALRSSIHLLAPRLSAGAEQEPGDPHGLGLGLALATKFSAVVLLPVALLLVAIYGWTERETEPGSRVREASASDTRRNLGFRPDRRRRRLRFFGPSTCSRPIPSSTGTA